MVLFPSTINAVIQYFGTKQILRFMTPLWTSLLIHLFPDLLSPWGITHSITLTTSLTGIFADATQSPIVPGTEDFAMGKGKMKKRVIIYVQSLPATTQPHLFKKIGDAPWTISLSF